MDFESKVISRDVSEILWETEKTVSTAESCTGGRIGEAMIAVPGASKYFKGGIISYVNEVKESLLGVDHQLLEEKTAVCEEVAVAMVSPYAFAECRLADELRAACVQCGGGAAISLRS